MFKKVKILANSENQCVTEKPRTVMCPQEDLANGSRVRGSNSPPHDYKYG